MNPGLWWKRILARYEAATSGYLPQVGWLETRARRVAQDQSGSPIPWFTYPAIKLLGERVQGDWRVLEFGAGMGTMWWSARVRETVAIEHDAQWADRVARQCTAKVLVAEAEGQAAYLEPAARLGTFDVVIVDGLHRNACMEAAPALLGDRGVVVLDDAQRPEYASGIALLRERGFRILPLHGPQPVSKHPGCTAILYRDSNVTMI